jgi:hypothetical protein
MRVPSIPALKKFDNPLGLIETAAGKSRRRPAVPSRSALEPSAIRRLGVLDCRRGRNVPGNGLRVVLT